MTITIKQINELFNEWNKKAFNNELPIPSFELMQTKRTLGQFRWRKIGIDKIGYTIRISTFYDRPLESYIDTIVHEMLHFYIRYKGIKDTSSHGRIWKRMAGELSDKFNLTITRTNPAGGGACEAVIEKRASKKVAKYEYVFLCKMRDGIHYGAAVAPSSNIYKLVPRFKNWKAVVTFKVVKAPWNETYALRHLRTACGVGYVDKKIFDDLWQYNGIKI